jgi:hypothetical protein
MPPLPIGMSAVVSLLFLASLTVAIMLKVKSARDDVPWSMQDGERVLATITGG